MDAVAVGSIIAVGITIAIVVFLAIRIGYLINHTHSED
jgi:FlaG/FlaF family flagellin (archaellin)